MMQVIKLASSTEFATKIRKESNFCTEVIHFKLEALKFNIEYNYVQTTKLYRSSLQRDSTDLIDL